MRVAPPIILTPEERDELIRWSHGRSTQQRLILRANIVLNAADKLENQEIAEKLKTNPDTVSLWRRRFQWMRLDGICKDAPRPGRLPEIPQDIIDTIIHKTLHEKPSGETHWSTRTMAKTVGVSRETVRRVWKAHRLKPYLVRKFKIRVL